MFPQFSGRFAPGGAGKSAGAGQRPHGRQRYTSARCSLTYTFAFMRTYEQLVKNGTPLEQADIQNRFEIRLK